MVKWFLRFGLNFAGVQMVESRIFEYFIKRNASVTYNGPYNRQIIAENNGHAGRQLMLLLLLLHRYSKRFHFFT